MTPTLALRWAIVTASALRFRVRRDCIVNHRRAVSCSCAGEVARIERGICDLSILYAEAAVEEMARRLEVSP